MKVKNTVGIISYGVSIPSNRIRISEIAAAWGKSGADVEKGLGVYEKSVPAADEDALTLAANAALNCLAKVPSFDKSLIQSIYTGSESHPYAVKSTSSVIAEVIGISTGYTAADFEFACKAGTAAMQVVCAEVSAGMVEAGVAIGADTAQSRPGDALEYTAGAGAAAYIIGNNKKEIIAEILYTTSFSSDTPDFWRREHSHYPSHAGRFTGEPSYFKHILGAVNSILAESKHKISDFDHVVLHMPNARFPKTAAKMLGITEKQLQNGFIVPELGNSYSACSLIGLAACLDKAFPGELILVCSYGSGSGSDAFVLKVNPAIKKLNRSGSMPVIKHYLSYSSYLKNLNKLRI